MRQSEFKILISKLDSLSSIQAMKLKELLEEKVTKSEVADAIDSRLQEHPACPRCASESIGNWGHRNGLLRYRCNGCHKTFNALTGSPLARLRHKSKWAKFAQGMKAGASVRTAAADCGVHSATTFKWRHRWLAIPNNTKGEVFTDIVEADETFFLESFKGSRIWAKAKKENGPEPARQPRKRGGKATKRGLSHEQIPVLVVRDRHGTTTDSVLPALNKESIKTVLKPIMTKDTLLCTDGLALYKQIADEEGYAHQSVNVSNGQRVKDGVFHIQHVNAYHSHLKEWLGRFRGVSTKHLANYLGWYRMLEKNGPELTPVNILKTAIG